MIVVPTAQIYAEDELGLLWHLGLRSLRQILMADGRGYCNKLNGLLGAAAVQDPLH